MRRTAPLLVAVALVAIAHLFVPRPVAACSCVAPEDIIEMADRDPGTSVFTATAGPRVGDDIPVVVTRWLKGPVPPVPTVIKGGDPLDMCGPTSPPAGGEYLFVTYVSETSRLTINGCSVQADVSTPEGAAMLARAVALFGPGAAPPSEAPVPPDVSSAQPSDGGVVGTIMRTAAPIALAAAFALGLIAGLAPILRRRGGGAG